MKKIRLRKILQLVIFLFSFLFLTIPVYYLYEPMVEPYNKVLIQLVPNQVFKIKKIIAYSVKGSDIFLYTRGNVPNKITQHSVNGLFLHANIIPVVAIFLATYIVFFASFNVAWYKKVFYFLASLFFIIGHGSFLAQISNGRVLMLFGFLEKIRIFFEQVERMIIPFFLWAIFCLRYVWFFNDSNDSQVQASD